MTNGERIRSLSDKELAQLLIRIESEPDYDEDCEGEWFRCRDVDYYITSNNEKWMDYDDALEYETKWLKQKIV